MRQLFDKLETVTGKVQIKHPSAGSSIEFSNSSSPPKWFALTAAQLSSALADIANNLDAFTSLNANRYDESNLRRLFESHLTDPVVKALAGTQTRPVYTVLAKIVHCANSDTEYVDRTFNLEKAGIENAIRVLEASSISLVKKSIGTVQKTTSTEKRITGGDNVLYYGAPGTGKSHTVNERGSSVDALTIRTVFHPDMQNSDFIGSLRPGVAEDGTVTYKFRPGPFSRALKLACDTPSSRVHLVIEEINRAMASAVFGEVFQLLDRDADGNSEYDVDAPSEEFSKWFGKDRIKLPSNLWLLATMNSADQGVHPLDTAFRRRWIQTYIPIDYNNAPSATVSTGDRSGNKIDLHWKDFIKSLNDFLVSDLEIPEDRLVGPRYATDKDLSLGCLPGKLLIYLWDDLLRHHGRQKLFLASIKTYGALDMAVRSGQQIFSDNFLSTLATDPDKIETD